MDDPKKKSIYEFIIYPLIVGVIMLVITKRCSCFGSITKVGEKGKKNII